MTDAERLAWACGVLNREGHAGLTCWVPADNCVAAVTLASSGGTDRVEALGCFEAIAIALALDERARRRLPDRKQAEWAAGVMTRFRHASYPEWGVARVRHEADWCAVAADGVYMPSVMARVVAEAYIRDEMLPDGPGEEGGGA